MIKKICITVLILCMLPCLSGCGTKVPKTEPLRICLDVTFSGVWNFFPDELALELEEYLEDEKRVYGHVDDVEIELIPRAGTERTEAIKRIREEIADGDGPDLFMVSNATRDNIGENALFPLPEQAMADGVFLSLDDYMANAQFTHWDEMNSVIMSAGRNENGQQIIPMSYTLPVTCFRSSEVTHTVSAENNWSDMLYDRTGVLQAAGLWMRTKSDFYPQWEGDYLEYVLGDLVDFETGELLFTQQELENRIEELLALSKSETEGAFSEIPAHYQVCMNVGYSGYWSDENIAYAGISDKEQQTMVPIYSDDGGITATVLSYAAVNANSAQPETAFMVLDYLLCRPMQMNSKIYHCFVEDVGMPMYEGLACGKGGIRVKVTGWGYRGWESWQLKSKNGEVFEALFDHVTHVRFRDTLEVQLDELFQKCYMADQIYNAHETPNLETMVEEAYAEMEEIVRIDP